MRVKLVRLILYGLIAFFVFRVIRVVTRMAANRKRETRDDTGAFPPPGRPVRNARDLKNIQDAEFEDLTPRGKSTASPDDTSP